MTINQLECFYTVGKTLSFNVASKELYISQPAISKQIAHMEEELGFKLFKRNNRNVSFTKQGEIFYQSVCKIMQEYKEALNQCNNLSVQQLNIGYFVGVKEFVFTRFIAPIIENNPELTITTTSLTGQTALSQLKNRQIDLLFSSNQFIKKEPSISFKKLADSNYYACMRNDHPLANKTVINPYDFNGIEVIPTVKRNQSISSLRIENDILECSPNVNFVYENDTIDATTLSLLKGKTVAILPESRCNTSKLLVAIPFESKYSFPIGYFYLTNNQKVKNIK